MDRMLYGRWMMHDSRCTNKGHRQAQQPPPYQPITATTTPPSPNHYYHITTATTIPPSSAVPKIRSVSTMLLCIRS
uniref:Uncharacterized protein n=1 Tax=Setaria digitata TaxID=48799 RepID=A0A915PFB0_9BILA